MQCPCCGAETDPAMKECPDCGLTIEGLTDAGVTAPVKAIAKPEWPDGEKPKLLKCLGNASEQTFYESLLHGFGIPTHTVVPLKSQFSSTVFGGPLLGTDLFVPESRFDEASDVVSIND